MNVIIDSKVYQDGQKIKWKDCGDTIYGAIHYVFWKTRFR